MKATQVIAVALLALFVLSCGKEDPVVAEVLGKKIRAQEFKTRYETYLGTVASRDNILLRQRILNNMINEVLIMDDLARQGLDRDEVALRRVEEIELQALVDRYARMISVDTVEVSEPELWQEFRNFNSKVSARYLYARTEREARELRQRLQQGATFEELARDVFEDPGLANNGGYLGSFGWGEMEPALEEVAFALPVGELSEPVRLSMGYAIVRVENCVRQPLASEYDYAQNKLKLERAIFDRKVVRLVKQAVTDISAALAPEFDQETVDAVFAHWSFLLPAGKVTEAAAGDGLPSNLSSMPLVRFARESWTVGDFVSRVEKTTPKQRRRVKSPEDVRDMAIGLAARDELVARARKARLERDAAVQAQITRVRDEFMLKRWAASVQDSVGQHGWPEQLLRRYYEAGKQSYAFPPEVNVGEILVRTEEEADVLFTRLWKGADFSELARKHSIRLWAAKRGGELGFNTRAGFGILGEKFFAARIGDIIGPEAVDPYYGIFRIVGRREGRPKSFEEAKEDIAAQLRFTRREEAFQAALHALRQQADIRIDDDALAHVVIESPEPVRKDRTP